jgi:hypothetical protein
MREWLGSDYGYRLQGDGDLGARLRQAVGQAFVDGAERAVVIGSDCPGLGARQVRQAAALLEQADLVVGPATDGGYYLLGLRRPVPDIFSGMAWGSDAVCAQTLAAAARLGLEHRLLEPLSDVDRGEDLTVWWRASLQRALPQLSVVIPALNEAALIGGTIERVFTAAAAPLALECLVVDGGSNDATVHEARTAGARVLQASGGRAVQLNTGAAHASGELLLFLHADTLLPQNFDSEARRLCCREPQGLGAFRLGIAGAGWPLRLTERLVSWRSRLIDLPYGDQALFLRRDHFTRLGGFPALPIMEDYALVRRGRHRGSIMVSRLAVATSARRWQRLGYWRTFLRNQLMLVGFHIGVAPEKLAAWYRKPQDLKRKGR